MTDTNPRTEARQLLDAATPGTELKALARKLSERGRWVTTKRVPLMPQMDEEEWFSDPDDDAAAEAIRQLADALPLIAALLAELDARTDPEPWYVTVNGPAFTSGMIVAGPFTTRDDAFTARTAIEARSGGDTYWVRPASEMTGGAT